jgi:hypothetical protein
MMISGLAAWYHKAIPPDTKTPGEFPKPEYGIITQ